jgi:hypothetical protein
MSPDPKVIDAIQAGCQTLSMRALAALEPSQAARLDAHATPFVVVALSPTSAGVFADVEGAEPIQLARYGGDAFPADMGAAVAAFAERATNDLAPKLRTHVVGMLEQGGARLSLMVEAFPPSIALLFHNADEADPTVLMRARPKATAH